MPRRFLTIEEVAEELGASVPQVYALVRRRDLSSIKIGGAPLDAVLPASLLTCTEDRRRTSTTLRARQARGVDRAHVPGDP